MLLLEDLGARCTSRADTRAVGYLLKAERHYISFHATLPEAQEAAEGFPKQAELLVQTTFGTLHSWYYDWETNTWNERGGR